MKEVLNKLKMRLPAIFLLAATLLFWPGYDPCRISGPALLENLSLQDAVHVEGDCAETDSVFALRRPKDGPIPRVRFRVPDFSGTEMLRVRGRLRAQDVVPGKYSFRSARLVLMQYTDGNLIGRYDNRVYGTGTFDWTICHNDYSIYQGIDTIEIALMQEGVSGSAEFDSVQVHPVKLRSGTPWVKGGFALAWLGLGIFYYPRCRLHSRKLRHLILLNVLLILVGILLPSRMVERAMYEAGHLFSRVQCPIAPWPGIQTSVDDNLLTAGINVDLPAHFKATVGRSTGHFILFGTLCFLVLLSGALEGQPNSYYFKVAFDVLLFGAITESLQHLTPDRTVDMVDMLCNAYGMLTAMVLFIVLRTLWRNPVRWIDGKTN